MSFGAARAGFVRLPRSGLLLAASEDAGIDAGMALKAAVTEAGGRGGGNARVAQGSVTEQAALEKVVEKILG